MFGTGVASSVQAPAGPSLAKAPGGPYNILFILTDQERYFRSGELPKDYVLPAHERLAKKGIVFENHQINSAVCTSSRSVLYTGQHIQHTKMFDNTNFPWISSMSTDIPTVGRALLAALPICLFFAGLPVLASAHDYPRPTPVSENPFEGTWRSGNFAFTFYGNGRYVYVGVMGNSAMTSRISEQGTYGVVGSVLLVKRERGVITTSANYRRDLPVETTKYPWQMGRIQGHLALQLVYPTGGAQVFYKE